MTYCAWTARSPTTPRSSSSSTRAVSPCPTRASENCARPRKARPLLPSAPHRARAPFPLTGQQLPCLGQSPFPVHPFGAMMPPPPLYDERRAAPGHHGQHAAQAPALEPVVRRRGPRVADAKSPLGGRARASAGIIGIAPTGGRRARSAGRPASRSARSTFRPPAPCGGREAAAAPRPTSAPAFRRCISPFGLFKPVATDASNSYLTAMRLVVRPQVLLPRPRGEDRGPHPAASRGPCSTDAFPLASQADRRARRRATRSRRSRAPGAPSKPTRSTRRSRSCRRAAVRGGASCCGRRRRHRGGGIGSNVLAPQAPPRRRAAVRGGGRAAAAAADAPERARGGAGAKKGAGVNFSVAKKR